MAFTMVTVTRTYKTPAGHPAQGYVWFTPSSPMVNGATTIAAPERAVLDSTGSIAIVLAANNDPGTTPVGTAYRVVEDLTGQVEKTYNVIVPNNAPGGVASLSTLAPVTISAPAVQYVTSVNGQSGAVTITPGGGGGTDDAGWANVLRFGAVGNGSTDDGPAIRAARDSLPASGGTVYFPGGFNYRVSTGNIQPGSKMTYAGDGSPSIITRGTTGPLIPLASNTTDVTIRDLKLVGNWATYQTDLTNAIGQTVTGTGGIKRVRIERVEIDGWYGAGIIILGSAVNPSSDIKIQDCTVTNIGQWGIICQDYVDDTRIERNDVSNFGVYRTVSGGAPGITAGRDSIQCIVVNNTIDGTGGIGVSAHGISIDTVLDNATVTGNVVRNCTGYGIEVGFVRNGSFIGNTVEGCTRAGIGCSGSGTTVNLNCTISDNAINDCGQGILVFVNSPAGSYQEALSITDNVIRNPVSEGINITYTRDSRIAGNIIRGAATSGIWIDMTNCQGLDIADNRIKGCNTSANASHGGLRIVTTTTASTKALRVRGNYLDGNGVRDWYPTEGANPLDYRFLSGDATPSVAMQDVFRCIHTSPTSITAFDDGYEGQLITVEMTANTTIVHNTAADGIRCFGGVNIVGAADKVAQFRRMNTATGVGWRQVSVSP